MSTSLYSGRSSYGGGVPSSRSYGIGDYGGSSYRSARDSSLGRNYTNYSSSYTAASPVIPRRREASVARFSGGGGDRSSVLFGSSVTGLGSETARYNREEAIKEIHSNFERSFNETSRKYGLPSSSSSSSRASVMPEDSDLTRARARIIGLNHALDQGRDERMARRDCLR